MSAGSDGPFRGTIGKTVAGSSPWWPPTPKPPALAPNILVVLFDDVGFCDRAAGRKERAVRHRIGPCAGPASPARLSRHRIKTPHRIERADQPPSTVHRGMNA